MDRRQFIQAAIGMVAAPLLPDLPVVLPVVEETIAKPMTAGCFGYFSEHCGCAILDNREILLGEFD